MKTGVHTERTSVPVNMRGRKVPTKHISLPRFTVNIDKIIKKYERVYIFGDLHDNENIFKTYLLRNDIAFILPGTECDMLNITNMYVKPSILLIFLGDVIYKTKGHFKSIFRFILNNRSNCLLFLGNNEVKFVYKNIHMFLPIAKQCVPRRRYETLRRAMESKQAGNKIVSSIYSIMDWFHSSRDNNLKKAWKWYYECLQVEYHLDRVSCEDLMILMYILTESAVIGFSNRLKLILLHAGCNPNRALKDQLIVDVCNIRIDRKTKTPWFWHYSDLRYVFLFGHWSELTVCGKTAQPFYFNNVICLDTGCCYTNVLTCVSFCMKSITANDQLHFIQNMSRSNDNTFYDIVISS